MKLFLTSVAGCLDSIDSFKELINPQTKLVVLPFSYHKDYINCSEDIIDHFDRCPSNKDSIYWHTVMPFVNAGILPERISIINQYTDTIDYIKYKLAQPNTIVYLPGGYPENIVENVLQFDLLDSLKNCEIIVGESAGSMAVFSKFFVYKDQDYKRYKRYKGLGFIKNMTLIPHFRFDNKFIMEACGKFNKRYRKIKIFCVMDGGYVVIENGELIDYDKTYICKRCKKKLKRYIGEFIELLKDLI